MIYKRARKYGGFVTGITQNVEDLLVSQKARSMLANSEFVILLDQAPTDREIIIKLWKLSEMQAGYITSAEPGSGLMIYGNTIIPFEYKYPKDNAIFKILTTSLQDEK
jgi:type IV secretory pathway VirB4 component